MFILLMGIKKHPFHRNYHRFHYYRNLFEYSVGSDERLQIEIEIFNDGEVHIFIIIIIIIMTRPRPAFGRLGLGRSSGGYSSHE